MTACGFKTCNFDAASSLTRCVFASVAKATGVSELPGEIRLDFPAGCGESGDVRDDCCTRCDRVTREGAGEL